MTDTVMNMSSSANGHLNTRDSVQLNAVPKIDAIRDWFHHEELFIDKVSALVTCLCCSDLVCLLMSDFFTFSGLHKTGLDLSQVLAPPFARGLCVHQSIALIGLPCLLLRGSVSCGLCIRAVGRGVYRSYGQLLRMAVLLDIAVHYLDEDYEDLLTEF